MRQTVPSHPVIVTKILKRLVLFFVAIVLLTPAKLTANSASDHEGELVINFTFVPPNITVECNNVPGPGTPIAEDNCPGDISISLSETTNQTFNGECSDFNYNITRTWTATNGCGESASVAQVVEVGDSQAPTLSALPADITIFQAQGQTIPVNDITASDNCSGFVDLIFNEGSDFGACTQEIGRTWTATDRCGNSFVHNQQITFVLDWFVIPEVVPQSCDTPGSISLTANNGSGQFEVGWQDFPDNSTTFQGGLTAGDYFFFFLDQEFGCKQELTVTVPFQCDPNQCTANAGTLSANGGVPCQQFPGENINISATPNGDMFVPNGFGVIYVLTEGPNLIIQDAQPAPNFTIVNPGNYTIHTLIFDPNTLDLGIIQPGVTSGFEVNALLIQGGGSICASLDVNGASIFVEGCAVTCTDPVVDNIVVVESTCNNSIGSININLTTPNTDFSYNWDPNVSSTNSASNLAAGVYNVTISANNGSCSIVQNIIVDNSDGPQGQVVSMVPADCSAANGIVTLGPNNLTFDWGTVGVADGNDPNFTRINLFTGIYQVTVTEPNNSCISIFEVTVDQNNNIGGGFVNGVLPDVNQSNGAVIITTTTPGVYLYKWNDGFQTSDPNRFNLVAGNYSVAICDTQNSGCEDVVVLNLPNNNPNCNATINLVSPLISVSCIGEQDAMIQFTTDFPAGCIDPQTTQIQDVNGNVVTNGALPIGNYCVVVTEGNGTIAASECFEVIEPDAIVVDIQSTPATCAAGGTILLDISGGSSPYTVAWSDGVNTEDRFNLPSGIYTSTVTDAAGCQAVGAPIAIADECMFMCNPATINNVVVVEANCGQSNGFVEIGIFEDVAGYTFAWSPDLGTPTAANVRQGVPAGSYTVIVTDNSDVNCTSEVTAIVGNVDGPEAVVFATFGATCEESNGTATLLPADFEYTWSDGNPNGQPDDMRTDLPAGIYQVTVVDPNGDPNCINLLEVEIGVISPVGLSFNVVTQPDCGQANGLVIVGAFGGAGPYSFDWSDGFVNPDPLQPGTHTDMAAGDYCVTVTDLGNLGCVEELCFILTNTVAADACANVLLPADTIFTSCPGVADGNANFTIDFCPNFAQPATTQIFSNGSVVNNGSLGIGEHCIAVTDANGCIVGESCFTVLDPENLDLDIEITPISCITGGIIDVMATGGTGNYTFTWDPVFPDQGTITNLDLGAYSVTVTDSNGCSSSASNLTITNACGNCDPFFPTDSLEIAIDCDLGRGELCLDIPFTDFQNVVIEDNFFAYDTIVGGCNFDSTFCYSTPNIPQGGAVGPYTIASWPVVLNGQPFVLGPQGFNTIDDLVNQMNGWDPTGNWAFDPTTFNICGGDINNTYGTITVIQDATGAVGELDLSITATPQGTALFFEMGGHTVVLSDTLTGCSDTLELSVICDVPMITTETLNDTIQLGPNNFGELCADTTELPGIIISAENICPNDSGNEVDFEFNDSTFCVTYEGIGIGGDPYCLVLCDDQGFCDTTFFVVTVLPGDGDPPMLEFDEANTIKNSPIVISVAENDFNEGWTDFGIAIQPNNGDAQQNEINETITYSPAIDFCGEDQFTYFFANENGIDSAVVMVTVSCECLVIFDGISPNGDGLNDGWIIEGIENFPNNEVCVYNRWGNQVFRREGYSNINPFSGDWEGDDLPDGTYFYVIDLGDGTEIFNGIIQINR